EGAPERSPKAGAVAPSGIDGNGPKRFSVQRKMAIVARLLRGEPLELVARETNVSIARLSEWRERALAGAATALKERERDDRDDEIARLKFFRIADLADIFSVRAVQKRANPVVEIFAIDLVDLCRDPQRHAALPGNRNRAIDPLLGGDAAEKRKIPSLDRRGRQQLPRQTMMDRPDPAGLWKGSALGIGDRNDGKRREHREYRL